MGMRLMTRGLGLFTIASFTVGAVASCGSGNDASTFHGGGYEDASTDGTAGTADSSMIGTFGGDSGTDGSGGPACKTCKDLGYTCGMNGDGCGHMLDCGTCQAPEYCGGGGYSKCGGNTQTTPDGSPACNPKTCPTLGYTCGPAGDGCGGLLQCGTCANPAFCGGGGFNKCGGNDGLNPDGGVPCTPTTCAKLGYDCGFAGDGCGGVLNCGSCTAPQYCGGNGYDKCGGNIGTNPADGGALCKPTTCAAQGYNCGFASDGCGNALMCGSCTAPEVCGGGGFDKCGTNGFTPDGSVACTPETCVSLGYTCGTAGDGCGGVLSCGSCTAPQYCGGAGFDKCGGNTGLGSDGGVLCTPYTCASLGYNCGAAGDGCGGLLSCGTCTSPSFCGGGGYDKCGTGTGTGSACDSGTTTTLTGYVFDPANNLPIYNALVYVPVGTVQTPQTGVVPAQCGCAAQPAYASAFTGIDGKFTLSNPPSGSNVTVVVQLGKWQRVFSESITGCTANALGGGTAGAAGNLTLPSTHLQGNIPLFAVDTGNVDSMECVLLKMGIAQSEFVDPNIMGGVPTAAERIHVYEGSNHAGGAIIDGQTPTEDQLTESSSVMNSYDVLLFPCQGGRGNYSARNGWPNTYTNMANYAAAGGRFFTTHFHYDLLEPNPAFSGTANWNLDNGTWGNLYSDPQWTADINLGFARAVTLAQWLNQPIVYGGTYGQIPVGVVRNDYSSVNAPALNWLTAAGGGNGGPPQGVPEHYTFDTPFNQSPTCGRVVYSDFHVESEQTNTGYKGVTFPMECPTGGMTPQEKLLEFMLFDLTSCTSPPTCQPLTCANFPAGTCGPQGDGCGGVTADCGTCTPPQTCGGGGTPGMCGYPDGGTCTPKTCMQQNINCGPAGDGCGNEIMCGTCTPPATCGGGGVPGQCGYPDGGACSPKTCAEQNINCGPAGDGCGNEIMCGTCTPPQTCGGGGVPGQCGVPDGGLCKPETCAQQNITCGPAGDGCGNEIMCGTCTPPQTCGGGGVPGHCGYPDAGTCKPLSCAQQNITCGPAGDGCGNELMCGPCNLPATCGGGGVPGQCGVLDGSSCKPLTCAQQNIACGPAGDGCGNLLQCGTCPTGQTCGGGGVPGQCGSGNQ
jgi:hypothetical protein